MVHQKLRERKKKPGESTTEYLYKMLSMASLANVDLRATITYVVDGLPGSVQLKNFMYEATSLPEFKMKLKSYEILRGRNGDQTDSRKTAPSTIRCLNCGSKSHEKEMCPFKSKGARCFSCDDFGNVSSCCPNRESTSKGQVNVLQRVVGAGGDEQGIVEEEDVEKNLWEWTRKEMGRRGMDFGVNDDQVVVKILVKELGRYLKKGRVWDVNPSNH